MAHTPWTIQEIGRTLALSGEKVRDFAIRDKRNICVALVGSVDAATKDDNEAHAHLMRAAPELLEALKDMLGMGVEVERAYRRIGHGHGQADAQARLDKARAAIAAAEGRR